MLVHCTLAAALHMQQPHLALPCQQQGLQGEALSQGAA
jgi:hypothetical protein